jgi:hypothetical protein
MNISKVRLEQHFVRVNVQLLLKDHMLNSHDPWVSFPPEPNSPNATHIDPFSSAYTIQ